MTLFSITCTTCQTRLKVRDEAVIGEILACPKCQSMVLVEPPAGWQGAASASSKHSPPPRSPRAAGNVAPAPLSSTFDDAGSLLSDERPPPEQPFLASAPLRSDAAASMPEATLRESAQSETVDQPIETHLDSKQGTKPPIPKTVAQQGKSAPSQVIQSTAVQPPPRKPPTANSTTANSTAANSTTANSTSAEPPAAKPATAKANIEKSTPTESVVTKSAATKSKAIATSAAVTSAGSTSSASEPLLPNGELTSPATQRWRQIVLIAGGGTLGLLLAVGVFGYLISRRPADSAQPVAAGQDSAPPSEDSDSAGADSATDSAADAQPTPASDATPVPSTSGTPIDGAPVPGPMSPGAATPAAPGPVPETPVDGGAVKPAPAVGNPFDLDPPSRSAIPAPAAPATVAESAEDLAGELEKFAPFLDGTPFEARTALERPAEKDAADEAALPDEAEPVVDESRAPRPAARTVNVAAQLELPIAKLEFEAPLIDFLRFISQLSGVPVSVEPEALAQVRLSLASPVKISLGETTVKAALEAALGSQLGYEASAGHLRITSRAAGPKLREAQYQVDDLLDGDLPGGDLPGSDAERLDRLKQMVGELIEPELWLAEDAALPASLKAEGKSLVVAAPERVHFQVLVLCEKLRVARGRSLRSTSIYPAELFALATRRERAAEKLSAPLSLNFGRPTLLVEILARIERESGVRILVDWQAVEAAGWNPDGLASLTADKQPLGDALSALLLPMDLAWRVVDANTLEVTTPEALASRPELEFHRVGDLLASETSGELQERIRAALGPHHFRAAGGVGVLHFDEPGKCLIASLPQPQQDALVALLSGWRR